MVKHEAKFLLLILKQFMVGINEILWTTINFDIKICDLILDICNIYSSTIVAPRWVGGLWPRPRCRTI